MRWLSAATWAEDRFGRELHGGGGREARGEADEELAAATAAAIGARGAVGPLCFHFFFSLYLVFLFHCVFAIEGERIWLGGPLGLWLQRSHRHREREWSNGG